MNDVKRQAHINHEIEIKTCIPKLLMNMEITKKPYCFFLVVSIIFQEYFC